MISSPPIHAAHLVVEILSDDNLRTQWFHETKLMADRIKSMRTKLKKGLEDAGSKRDWSHITSQIGNFFNKTYSGMFCFSGLTSEQVERLRTDHHVYLTKDGRISMAGVTSDNVGYIAKAIVDVTTH
jgi:aspartate aminotransferase